MGIYWVASCGLGASMQGTPQEESYDSLETKRFYYPLAGKVFLLDLASGCPALQTIRQQIFMLGGVSDSQKN